MEPLYEVAEKKSDVLALLVGLIEKICLSSDISKYDALQSYLTDKRLICFGQHNGISLADYSRELQMLTRVAFQSEAEFETMDRIEKERQIKFPLTSIEILSDQQRDILYEAITYRMYS